MNLVCRLIDHQSRCEIVLNANQFSHLVSLTMHSSDKHQDEQVSRDSIDGVRLNYNAC